MRLKLVLIASLVAAIVGAGAAIAVVVLVFSSIDSLTSPPPLVASTYLLPALTIFSAAMFVYRHTARRRRLQAALTVLISLVLTLTMFVVTSMLTSRSTPEVPQPQPQHTVG